MKKSVLLFGALITLFAIHGGATEENVRFEANTKSSATQGSVKAGTLKGELQPSRYITYAGIQVALYESAGHHGPGILMVHGNTSSANYFAEIINGPFGHSYRVAAVDLPGYGNSQNAVSYNTAYLAGAIVAAANAVSAQDGVIVGWSLGGDLMLQAASQLPLVKGYFMFGTAPLGYAPTLPSPFLTPAESYAGDAVNFGLIPNLTAAQVNAYVTAFFRPNYPAPIPPQFFQDGQRTDPATRAAVYAAATGQDATFQDEIAILQNLNKPVAILLADHDAFVRPAYLTGLAPTIPTLWHQQIVIVSNSGHASQWEHPNTFVSLLSSFIADLH